MELKKKINNKKIHINSFVSVMCKMKQTRKKKHIYNRIFPYDDDDGDDDCDGDGLCSWSLAFF